MILKCTVHSAHGMNLSTSTSGFYANVEVWNVERVRHHALSVLGMLLIE